MTGEPSENAPSSDGVGHPSNEMENVGFSDGSEDSPSTFRWGKNFGRAVKTAGKLPGLVPRATMSHNWA